MGKKRSKTCENRENLRLLPNAKVMLDSALKNKNTLLRFPKKMLNSKRSSISFLLNLSIKYQQRYCGH